MAVYRIDMTIESEIDPINLMDLIEYLIGGAFHVQQLYVREADDDS